MDEIIANKNPEDKTNPNLLLKEGNKNFYQNNYQQAIQSYSRAINLKPECAEAYNNRGTCYFRLNQISQAIEDYDAAIKLKSTYVDPYFNIGQLDWQLKKYKESIKYFTKVIKLSHGKLEAYNLRGICYLHEKEYKKASKDFKTIIKLHPSYMDAYVNYALAHHYSGKSDQAIAICEEAINKEKNYTKIYSTLGLIYKEQGKYEKAIVAYSQAIILSEELEVYNLRGVAEKELLRLNEAISDFNHVIQSNRSDYLKNLASLNKSMILLTQGKYVEGFPLYEARINLHDKIILEKFPAQALWKGQDLKNKTIALVLEQGAGDTFQFLRFGELLSQKGAKIILFRTRHLTNLVKTLPWVNHYAENIESGSKFTFHYYSPLLSLAQYFVKDIYSIPNKIPYIFPDKILVEKYRNIIEKEKQPIKIGIVWSGNPLHEQNKARSVPIKHFIALQKKLGVKFFSLQVGETANQVKNKEVIRLDHYIKDYTDTAAIIANLDLVISVCTSIAHLTGAMGKPVGILLSYSPYWCWMLNREDSPWYPTARLFRQKNQDDWGGVFNEVEEKLKNFNNISAEFISIPESKRVIKNPFLEAEEKYQQKDFVGAIQSYSEIIKCNENNIQMRIRRGECYKLSGDNEKALVDFLKVIELSPNNANAYFNLSWVYHDLKDYNNSIKYANKAIELNPKNYKAFNTRGLGYKSRGEYALAIRDFDEAIRINDSYYVAYNNRGSTYLEMCNFEMTLKDFNKVIQFSQNNHLRNIALYNKGYIFLRNGNFSEGFPLYETRYKVFDYPENLKFPTKHYWHGESLQGKTMTLYFEQGAGDNIQFIRFSNLLKEQGAKINIHASEKLEKLIKLIPVIDSCFTNKDKGKKFGTDYYCSTLSVARYFVKDIYSIPNKVPYIQIPQEIINRFKKYINSSSQEIEVGIVWAGNPTHLNDKNRSIDVSQFITLQKQVNLKFYSLQVGERANDVTEDQMIRLDKYIKDYLDTAALIMNLDLVICVDTSVAHLAGALGKPVWILLPYSPDWRWLLDREDSPWYPTARLFRQQSPGDWEGVFERVEQALKTLIQ